MENYEENSRRTKRVRDASTVIGFLASQTPPELPAEAPLPEPTVIHITDRGHGWTADGEYI